MKLEQAVQELSVRFRRDSSRIVNWFELGFYCGIDVYGKPFDASAGYVTLEHPWMRAFVYRQDALPRLSEPLREFLGISTFELQRGNVSSEKWYADVYRETFKRFRLPEELVRECLAAPYMRHFFSEEERVELTKHWTEWQSTSSAFG